ncbi:MAG: glycosyltransferase [Lunatimonas sp.]|uniref:hypothetical protein n=1 Tax=Lunatimonas sp. TaxID=2060141 RepID=UPI00263B6690|nr:hypothetical protein [Lunatimonas sp.]MCC5939712.1 glycosyltransferase [Lunatimonas sp.]
MQNVFLYPLNQKVKGSPNPYMEHFRIAFSRSAKIVNAKTPHRGVLNLYFLFFRTDVFILNWIEFIEEKRFGSLQVFFLRRFLTLARIFGKKIVWVLHNKGSHYRGTGGGTKRMFMLMMKKSDHILTHSEEGLTFVNTNYPFAAEKVTFLLHPMLPPFKDEEPVEREFDLMIWGAIHKYKGIDLFFKFAKESLEFSQLKILLVGKCFDEAYKEIVLENLTENTTFFDQLYPLERLSQFASRSKFVLFTYMSETVISSGALMDTLRMNTQIIGPDYAAFKDLSYLPCVQVFQDFSEIPIMVEAYDKNRNLTFQMREKFYLENSWDCFIDQVSEIAIEPR